MRLQQLKYLLLGEPLVPKKLDQSLLSKTNALAILASDALSSIAYANENILRVLVPYHAYFLMIPMGVCILVLLAILTLSYQQTIDSYPEGGGAYSVSRNNLGENAGLIAAAALMIDYLLTVSVSVCSGTDQLISAFPSLLNHKILIEISFVIVLMILNLRGLKETSQVLILPTYLFIFFLMALIFKGFYPLLLGLLQSSHLPSQVTHSAQLFLPNQELLKGIPIMLLLKAFSSGCAALTGIEAISNGIPIFRKPSQKNAKITLFWMTGLLGFLFFSIQCLIYFYQINPTPHETTLSLLTHHIFGNNSFYYLVQIFTTCILFLAANTSYADFPSLASLLAQDRFVPRQLKNRGDRLVFSNGITLLSLMSALLILLFQGETYLLIPLYSIGIFVSFSLSQLGMAAHFIQKKSNLWQLKATINLLGSAATAMVLCIITMSKWNSGGWLALLGIALLFLLFKKINKHYLITGKELSILDQNPSTSFDTPQKHKVIFLASGIHRGVAEAIAFCRSFTPHSIQACHVCLNPVESKQLHQQWQTWFPSIPFKMIPSPQRSIVRPILDYLHEIQKVEKPDFITIVIPEFIPTYWFHHLLHNQTAFFLKTALLFDRHKVVITVRYHLKNT